MLCAFDIAVYKNLPSRADLVDGAGRKSWTSASNLMPLKSPAETSFENVITKMRLAISW